MPTTLPDLSISRISKPTPAVEAFFRSLTTHDRFLRFGTSSVSAAEWLLERIAIDARHGMFVARRGDRIAGILDACDSIDFLEFGIVVRSDHRRRGVARALLSRSFQVYCGMELRADCSPGNVAARGLLAAFGFSIAAQTDELMSFYIRSASPSAIVSRDSAFGPAFRVHR